MAYASLSDLTAYLGIDESAIDDVLLTQLLARAQAAVDEHCNRTFEAPTATARRYDYRSINGRTLHIDADLCAISSIVNGDGVTIAGTEYTTEPRNVTPWHALRLRPASAYAWDGITGDIVVTGKWAHSATAPADVQHATVRLAAWMYRQKDNTGNDAPVIAGDITILPARIPSDIERLLEKRVRDYV